MTNTRPIKYNPISVLEGAAGSNFKRVTAAVICAALVMLCLGSQSLLSWANDLPINNITDYMLYLAQSWQDWMDKAGITVIAEKVHDVLLALQALSW